MIVKHILFCISFASCLNGMHTSAFAAMLVKSAQKNEKSLLFTQAEQHEKDFLINLGECTHLNNCQTHEKYQEARHNALHSSLQLMLHIQKLEQDTRNKNSIQEKTEAKNIKSRLTELLMKNQ
ncbi:MAG TPA: hypothetical protein VKU36_04905 [Candidatus Babeliales bacterium]|nr:hypothetical protein [Candidatus Babeliales bacterium]